MADSGPGRLLAAVGPLSRREAAALGALAVLFVASHVVAPAVIPEYAVHARYATYLVGFSVWMAWFVDWLAVWLGKAPHPSEQERSDDPRDA